jgi:dTMP kinase
MHQREQRKSLPNRHHETHFLEKEKCLANKLSLTSHTVYLKVYLSALLFYYKVEHTILSNMSKTKTLQKGCLIVIEGIDGAGKTTQAQLLTKKLLQEGYPTVSLHEPTNSTYGIQIRSIAKGEKQATQKEELELFIQDRILDVKQNIQPALDKCQIVIMDRYYFSSIAYQSSQEKDLQTIEEQNKAIAPEPDLLIILDVPPEVSLERISQNRADGPNMFENNIRLERARNIFNGFKNREFTQIIEGNGQRDPQKVAKDIWSIVQPLIVNLIDVTV